MEMSEKKRLWTVGTLSYTTVALIILFGWLLIGDFAWSMKERGVNSTATLMIRNFGVSDFLYSIIIISIPSFTNIFLGPIVSYLSDRHRGKWGRRIPYLVFTTPFIVVGLLGLAATPRLAETVYAFTNGSWFTHNTFGLIFFGIFWLLLDFGTTLANVIFVALVNDVVPKACLGRFFGLFRAASLGAGILFNNYLLAPAQTHGTYIFAGLGIIYGIGFTLMCLMVKEGQYPPVSAKEKNSEKNIGLAVKNYFRECFSLSYYRWVIIAYVLAILAALPLNAYTLFYAESINVSLKLLGKYLALTYIISFFLSFPLGMLADKIHPIRATLVAVFGYFLFSIAGIFCVKDQTSFAVIFILHGVISGCVGTLSSSYGQKLFPSSIFAQFNSAMMGVLFIGFTLVAPLVGKILDLTGKQYHYVFYAGGFIAILGVFALLIVLREYNRLGGDRAYQAPTNY